MTQINQYGLLALLTKQTGEANMNNIITLHPSVEPAEVFDMMNIYKAITGVTCVRGRPCLKTYTVQSNQGCVKVPNRKGQLRGLPSNPVKVAD